LHDFVYEQNVWPIIMAFHGSFMAVQWQCVTNEVEHSDAYELVDRVVFTAWSVGFVMHCRFTSSYVARIHHTWLQFSCGRYVRTEWPVVSCQILPGSEKDGDLRYSRKLYNACAEFS